MYTRQKQQGFLHLPFEQPKPFCYMVVFPFNFAHFADVVPDFLAFLVSWITNDIARVLIAIGMIGEIISVGIKTVLYIKVRAFLLQQQQSGNSSRVMH